MRYDEIFCVRIVGWGTPSLYHKDLVLDDNLDVLTLLFSLLIIYKMSLLESHGNLKYKNKDIS